MIKTKKQAEDLVYRSYLKAEKKLRYDASDSEKRSPEYSRALIKRLDRAYNRENILVTGSKGKGSVSVMISAVLQAHGKNVGMMTSPHILDFNERIRINDELVSDDELIKYCNALKPTLDLIDSTIPEDRYISPIGIQVLMALLHFKRRTDINIFECGKGVRYDDVNNLSRSYSVINRIFAEHTRELGDTVTKIADDKADIITKGQKCAYTAAQDKEAEAVTERRAKECSVPFKKYGRDFYSHNAAFTRDGMRFDTVIGGREYKGLELPLLGLHQTENCALAMAVCADILGGLDEACLKKALKGVVWHGRAEILSKEPLVIADACINRASAEMIKDILLKTGFKKLACVMAIPADKDYKGAADVMAEVSAGIIMTAAANPHYRFDKSQAEGIKNAVFVGRFKKAYETALKSGADTVCILGTTALLPEVYEVFKI